MRNRQKGPVAREVLVIRRSLSAIGRSLGRLAAIAKGDQRKVSSGQAPKRKLKLTAKRRAELKLQGQYMGYMRQLKPREKARVKAVRKKKGMRAAVAVAKRTAK